MPGVEANPRTTMQLAPQPLSTPSSASSDSPAGHPRHAQPSYPPVPPSSTPTAPFSSSTMHAQTPSAHCHLRTPQDAVLILEAVRQGLLPRCSRRLTGGERSQIGVGSVWVWEEEETNMRRWTDGRRWGASRVGGGGFLIYREVEGSEGGSGGGRRVGAPAAAQHRSSVSPPHQPNARHAADDDEAEDPANYWASAQSMPSAFGPTSSHATPAAASSSSSRRRRSSATAGGNDSDWWTSPPGLIKQTYSTSMAIPGSAGSGGGGLMRKFHVVGYLAKNDTLNETLVPPSALPQLAGLKIPSGVWADAEQRTKAATAGGETSPPVSRHEARPLPAGLPLALPPPPPTTHIEGYAGPPSSSAIKGNLAAVIFAPSPASGRPSTSGYAGYYPPPPTTFHRHATDATTLHHLPRPSTSSSTQTSISALMHPASSVSSSMTPPARRSSAATPSIAGYRPPGWGAHHRPYSSHPSFHPPPPGRGPSFAASAPVTPLATAGAGYRRDSSSAHDDLAHGSQTFAYQASPSWESNELRPMSSAGGGGGGIAALDGDMQASRRLPPLRLAIEESSAEDVADRPLTASSRRRSSGNTAASPTLRPATAVSSSSSSRLEAPGQAATGSRPGSQHGEDARQLRELGRLFTL